MNNVFLYLFLGVGTLAGIYISFLKIDNNRLNKHIEKLNSKLVVHQAQSVIYESDISNLKNTISKNNTLIDSMKVEESRLTTLIVEWKQKAADEKLSNEKLKNIITSYSSQDASGEACLLYNKEISKLKYKDL